MTAARPGHRQGVFVWDHVRWREPVVEVADPWITLAAVATSTERIRLDQVRGVLRDGPAAPP